MTTIERLDASIQVSRGARVSWHSLSGTPVPNLKYIYDPITRTIKIGDGVSFLDELSVWVDLNDIEEVDTFFKEYFSDTETLEPNKLLVLNSTGDEVEFSAVTVSELALQSQLASTLDGYSDTVHTHEVTEIDDRGTVITNEIGINPGQTPIVINDSKLPKRLFTNTTGLNSKQSDIVSYLVLARLAREDGDLLVLPNGIVDEFNTTDTIDVNDGTYGSEAYTLSTTGILESIGYDTDEQLSEVKAFIRGEFNDPINDKIELTLSRNSGILWNPVYLYELPMMNGSVSCYSGVCDLEAILTENTLDDTSMSFEDIKGDISLFTGYGSQTGQFDSAIDSKIVVGSIINTTGSTLTIVSITGDGTADGSIEFSGTLVSSPETVTAINNLEVEAGSVIPTSYESTITADPANGTNLGNMSSNDATPGIDKIFDGNETGNLDYAGYHDGTSDGWFGKQYSTPTKLESITILAPEISGVTELVTAGTCTAYLELSDDPTFGSFVTGATLTVPLSTASLLISNSITDWYTCWRVRIVSDDAGNRTQVISASEESIIRLYNENHNSLYIPANDDNIKNLITTSVVGTGLAYITFKDSDVVKVFTDTGWVDIVKYEGTTWMYLDSGSWVASSLNNYLTAVGHALEDITYRVNYDELSTISKYTSGAVDGIIISLKGNGEVKASYDSNSYKATIGLDYISSDTLIPNTDTLNWKDGTFEDVKGDITVFAVDTDQNSGYFDTAINSKIVVGCLIYTQGTVLEILSISGDGSSPGSITFTGDITPGVYTVNSIRGIDDDATIVANNIYTTILDLPNYEHYNKLESSSDTNVFYAVGNDTHYYIYSGGVWINIVKYESDVWSYMSGGSWVAAPINTPQSALSKVIEDVSYQMTRDQLTALTVTEFDLVTMDKVAAILQDSVITNKTIQSITIEGTRFIDFANETDLKWKVITEDASLVNTLKGIRLQYK